MIQISKFLLGSCVLGSIAFTSVNKVDAWQTPDFPSCNSFSSNGDWVTGVGYHHIPGQEQTIYGKDDVYYIGNGNFVQCLCPSDGNGVQTNWWNVDGMDTSVIENSWTKEGWYYEQGSSWNLMSLPYLAKNNNYSCGSVTPTPTPTVTVIPTITPNPTPTPTTPPSNPPYNPPVGSPQPPVCNDPFPETPTLLSVVKSGSDTVDLTWTEPDANVEYYIISYGHESGNYIYGVPNTGKTTSYRVGGLDFSKKYYFVVRSQKGCISSKASNELSYPKGQVLASSLANTNSIVDTMIKTGVVFVGLIMAGIGIWKLKEMA